MRRWMDEIHFAPPKKPWTDDSLVNTKQTRVPRGFKVVQDFVHPQYVRRISDCKNHRTSRDPPRFF